MSAYAAVKEGSIFQDEEIVIKYEESDEEEQINLTPNIPLIKSTFTVSYENLISNPSHVTIGLKNNESIAISGQFKFIVERGAVLVNNIHYYHAPQKFTIIQPNTHTPPSIASTQIINTDEVKDIRTDDNDHLFSSDYKSVVRFESMSTGLEDIGGYYPPFKNLFSGDSRLQLSDNYSFDIIPNGSEGLNFPKNMVEEINDMLSNLQDPTNFITIGSKNSGKSTISKLILNQLVDHSPVSVLDLDPGQSEYSKPYCLSLTNHFEPIHGFNYHESVDDIHCFYGFTNPQGNPTLYMNIISLLISSYEKHLKHRGHHLIINTPGWVKGYGKELLVQITEKIKPDNLIWLAANFDNDDTLQGLTFGNLKQWKGFFIQSRYSPAEVRNFSKLAYFHKTDFLKYNFTNHLLEMLPLRLSYQTDSNNGFLGVNAVLILNHDSGLDFDHEDLITMLEASIVGFYLIENEHYFANYHLIETPGSIPYLNSSKFNELIEYNTNKVQFKGCGFIHSINIIENYFNLYLPPSEDLNSMKKLMTDGYKLLIVKSESDIPKTEILMRPLIEDFKKRYKRNFKNNESLPFYPFVSYNNKINGVWKIRRNISRRGQL